MKQGWNRLGGDLLHANSWGFQLPDCIVAAYCAAYCTACYIAEILLFTSDGQENGIALSRLQVQVKSGDKRRVTMTFDVEDL